MTMAKLRDMQRQSLELFWSLNKSYGSRVAGPFVSVAPDRYCRTSQQRILYVGKATHGDWYRREFLRNRRLTERQREAKEFVREAAAGDHPYPFWRFAIALSKQLAPTPQQSHALQNLVWTNLTKVGVIKGNPTGKLLETQRQHSVEIMRAEIRAYDPTLIVFVAGDYGYDLIGEIIGDPAHQSWQKSNKNLWWRKSTRTLPALMWTRHPQGATGEMNLEWLSCAKRLMR